MLRDGRKKGEEKQKREETCLVFRFPRSTREFTAEVTCSLCLHCLSCLPSLSSKKESHVHVARHDYSLQDVSATAAALARRLSSLSFRLSYSPDFVHSRYFATFSATSSVGCSGMPDVPSLIRTNHVYTRPSAADFSLRIFSFKKAPSLSLPNAQINELQDCQKRKCKWYGNHKELGGRVRSKLELLTRIFVHNLGVQSLTCHS